MKYNHSSGKWRVEVHNKHTSIEADYFTVTNDVGNEDAERIVECVNALNGISNPNGIQELIDAAKECVEFQINGNALGRLADAIERLYKKK